MLKKKQRGSIALIIMIVITCFTQVITLLKSSIAASYFGASMNMDAYNFANSIVSFVFGFVASAISTLVIPSYVHNSDKKYINAFLTCIYGVIAVITIAILSFRTVFITNITGKSSLFIELSSSILIVLMSVRYLHSVTNITDAYFQCIGKYNIPKLINLFSQLLVVFCLIIIKNVTIFQYALILCSGYLFHTIFDVSLALWFGWRYHPDFSFRSQETKRLFRLFLPIIMSSGVYQLSLMIDSTIASRLETGQLSVLSYSSQIVSMLNALLIGNLLTFCYPKIVKRIRDTDSQIVFWNQTDLFHLIVCLVITGFASVGREGISLLFEHGQFQASTTDAVFAGSLLYIFGQQFNIVRDLIYRYFYASGDTKTAAANSVIVSVVNISVSLILVNFIGLYGIIAGTVIASFVSLVRIMRKFDSKYHFQGSVLSILRSFAINIIIMLITSAVIYLSKSVLHIDSLILSILLFGFETVTVFMGLTYLTKKSIFRVLKDL